MHGARAPSPAATRSQSPLLSIARLRGGTGRVGKEQFHLACACPVTGAWSGGGDQLHVHRDVNTSMLLALASMDLTAKPDVEGKHASSHHLRVVTAATSEGLTSATVKLVTPHGRRRTAGAHCNGRS
jgi:hypothetical protein